MRRPWQATIAAAAHGGLALVAASAAHRPSPTPVAAPAGMAYVPGGRTRIGSDDGPPSERPAFDADVRAFFLDLHPVTVADFRRFADATHYATQSERLGSSGVFDVATGHWGLVDGATWRRPRGPDAPPAPDDHPVTQVSWNDAVAYCAWAGKRLPTEVEWEHAARGGRAGTRYAWGDALVEGGRYRANTWQGHFPERNTVDDGYLYTSPVGAFGTTAYGLTDMGGNVWQWCADWFRPYPPHAGAPAPGPDGERVIRGGSFLCDPTVCHGFRVSARGHSTPETGLMHVGFRCARDVDDAARQAGAGSGAPAS